MPQNQPPRPDRDDDGTEALSSPGENGTKSTDSIHLVARSADFRIAAVESAAQWLGPLRRGSRVIGVNKGQFSFLDLMRAVLDQTGPARVALSAWTAGIQDIEHARYLIDNDQITSMWWLVDRSFVTRQPDYCQRLIDLFGEECLLLCQTHAKFATIRNDRFDVAIRGSANLNRNSRLEQFDVDDDAEIADFFDSIVAEFDAVQPAGIISEGAVYSVFREALLEDTCGDMTKKSVSAMTPEEQLARLGYGRHQIRQRLDGPQTPYDLGRHALEDSRLSTLLSTPARAGQSVPSSSLTPATPPSRT